MKNIFTPIFLTVLVVLNFCHKMDTGSFILRPLVFITLSAAAVLYLIGKQKLNINTDPLKSIPGLLKPTGSTQKGTWLKSVYILMTLSLSLLIACHFLEEKEAFLQETQEPLPLKEYITLYGCLKSFPEIRVEHTILEIAVSGMEYHGKRIGREFSARVKVKGDLGSYFKGDEISIDTRLYAGRFSRNFYPAGMEDYRFVRGNHFNGYCKSSRLVELLKREVFFWSAIGTWRNRVREVIERRYRGEGGRLDRKGVFLLAILMGDRGQLDSDQKEMLLNAGVFHLLAISGAHIGIIAIFSLLFLKALKIRTRKRYVITAVVLVLFLVLSGFKVSAERAVLMAVLIFMARFFYLAIDITNIISFAGLVILMRNPAEFLDAGFILTFTLTAAIVMGRKIFLPLGREIYGRFLHLAGKEPGDFLLEGSPALGDETGWQRFRLYMVKVGGYLKELVSANLSASLIALPLSLFYFKRYSCVGILAGLLLLPLTAVITAGGVLLLVLAPLSVRGAGVLLMLMEFFLEIFFGIVDVFSRGGFSIFRASPPVYIVLIILVSFYLLSLKGVVVRRVVAAVIFVVFTLYISVFSTFIKYSPRHLEVYYIDVGQGDSQVVVFPGGDALLIDGGGTYYSNFQVGKSVLLPFILQKGIRVRWVAVTHYHPDHVRGITEIINILAPEEIWISSSAIKDGYYTEFMGELMGRPGSPVRVVRVAGNFCKKVEDCTVEVLHPEAFLEREFSRNKDSQVLKVEGAYHSFLFTGDIGADVERELVEGVGKELRADVLKVPHHGSRTSSTVGFLKVVAPDWAIFSYGHGNRFGFPHENVMRNYKRFGIKHLSTAISGGIKITSKPDKLEIETSR
ncbi:MAG: MBL fold metallo-hydrolase [bacterium]|nr:MBL fold metallo-hydrolase [bacterium]